MVLLYIDFKIEFFLIELENFRYFDRDRPITLKAGKVTDMCLNALKMLHRYFWLGIW